MIRACSARLLSPPWSRPEAQLTAGASTADAMSDRDLSSYAAHRSIPGAGNTINVAPTEFNLNIGAARVVGIGESFHRTTKAISLRLFHGKVKGPS